MKALARFLLACAGVIGGFYAVILACVLFFKLTGRLAEGQPMYMDLDTPTYGATILLLLIAIAVTAGCLWVRGRLRS